MPTETIYVDIVTRWKEEAKAGVSSFERYFKGVRYKQINKRVSELSAKLRALNANEILRSRLLDTLNAKNVNALKELNLKYADNIYKLKKFNLETIDSSIAFRKWFGVLLSGMFVFRSLYNTLSGFIKQSTLWYIKSVSQNDEIAVSINRMSASWNYLRFSFVRALGEVGIFDTFARFISNISRWFEDMTPEQRKFMVYMFLLIAGLSLAISKLSEIGILLMSLKSGSFKILSVATLTKLAGIFLLVAAAIKSISDEIDDLKDNSKKKKEKLLEIWENFKSGIEDIFDGIKDFLKGEWKKGILKIFGGIGLAVVSAFDYVIARAIDMFRGQLRILVNTYNFIATFLPIPKIPTGWLNKIKWDYNYSKMYLAWWNKKFPDVPLVETEKKEVFHQVTVVVNLNGVPQYYSANLGNDPYEILGRAIGEELSRRGIGD